MKRIISIVLVCLMAIGFCSCAKGGSKSVSLYDLKDAMAAATDKFSEMKYASSADDGAESIFANITELDYGKVEGFFVYYAVDGTGNADEIAVITVKRQGDLALAKAALEGHLAKRKALYATYDKSQETKLERAKVVTYGSTAALVVADDADAVTEAFFSYMKQ